MAAMDEFRAVIRGKGGHTGAPHKAADPVLAARTHLRSPDDPDQEIDVFSPTLVMFGSVHAGGQASNIIPEEVSWRERYAISIPGGPTAPSALQRFERVLAGICAASGMDYSLNGFPATPAGERPRNGALVRDAASAVVGAENLVPYTAPPGRISPSSPGKFPRSSSSWERATGEGNDYPQHHPKFDIDEEALPAAVEILVRSALAFLGA
jgi:amidohydrolase